MLHVFSESLFTPVLGILGSEELRRPAEGWGGQVGPRPLILGGGQSREKPGPLRMVARWSAPDSHTSSWVGPGPLRCPEWVQRVELRTGTHAARDSGRQSGHGWLSFCPCPPFL